MPPRDDPAERAGYLRYFYRHWRPTRVGRAWSHLYAWVGGLGLLPRMLVTLQTTDSADGHDNSTILVAATLEGQRYLVSMLGEHARWVQNVRASGGVASIKRGASQPVHLVEIPPPQRAPILKAWAQAATSGRKHLPIPHDAPLTEFESIAGDYPVFRIDPALAGQPPDDA